MYRNIICNWLAFWFHPAETKLEISGYFNLLKPTGYVMHQQFNIQQLYALPTLYLFVKYLSENQQILPAITYTDWVLQPRWKVFFARYGLGL
jgi:hypothetical protein